MVIKTNAQKANGEYGLQELGSFTVDGSGWEIFFKGKAYYGGKEKKRTLKRIK
ncbi:hypothetical protein [Amylibacter sp. SFDW26]|uniref:hypothetical protein n=1 Tax=Amylibacter sp. SFDW26 TaxID=2652722 RepID=UPI001869CC2C|nr:hypothetical protein [Amylibacter sp. SFDW26]